MLEQELNDMNILALRDFARRLGVVSPTSKKKGQIIKEILEIKEGSRKPNMSTTRFGRPPKSAGFNFISQFQNAPVVEESNKCTLNQNTSTFSYNNITTISGYVEINGANSVVWNRRENKYYPLTLLNEVATNNHLLTGDLVTAELSKQNNIPYVSKVFNINGTPINKFNFKRANYEDIKHINPTKPLDVKSVQINQGECVYLYGTNNNNNTSAIVNLLNEYNGKKLYLNVTMAEKNIGVLPHLNNAELFVAKLTDGDDYCRNILNLATERAKRLFEAGENVVLAIDDVQSLSDVDFEDLRLTKQLISLTKNSNRYGSITLIAIMNGSNQFNKLYDKKFKVENSKIVPILEN